MPSERELIRELVDLVDTMPILKFDARTARAIGPDAVKYREDLAVHRKKVREWVERHCPEKIRK